MSQAPDWMLNNQLAQMYSQAQQNNNAFSQGLYQSPQQLAQPIKKKELSMFKEITSDVKGFVLEHRSIIYFLVFALLIDHFAFRGVFKARLESMVEKLVTKVEEKIK